MVESLIPTIVGRISVNISFPVKVDICLESVRIRSERSKKVAGTPFVSCKPYLKRIGVGNRMGGYSSAEIPLSESAKIP